MNALKGLFILGTTASILAMMTAAQAASFDCRKAATKVEKAICADDELSSLDEEMAATYQLALKKGKASDVKAEQREWLKERNSCDGEGATGYDSMDDCIKQQYSYRLFALSYLFLPQKLNTCKDLVIDKKITRFDGAVPGEAGGEVFVRMQHYAGFYILGVEGLTESDNADKYMFGTKDFAVGDKVKVCLTSVPADCPPGDDRGKSYFITNYKNGKSFAGTPDWHSCGGA